MIISSQAKLYIQIANLLQNIDLWIELDRTESSDLDLLQCLTEYAIHVDDVLLLNIEYEVMDTYMTWGNLITEIYSMTTESNHFDQINQDGNLGIMVYCPVYDKFGNVQKAKVIHPIININITLEEYIDIMEDFFSKFGINLDDSFYPMSRINVLLVKQQL